MCTGYAGSMTGGKSMTLFQNLVYLVRDWEDDSSPGEKQGFFEKLVSEQPFRVIDN